MKTAVFWIVAPDYTVLQPRRQQSSGKKVYDGDYMIDWKS
jgi:hypothetical protein